MAINLWSMIVLVVLIGSVAGTLQAYLKYRRPDGTSKADNRMIIEEVRTLRERVQVLERIATDKNHSLEHEIERLRDR